MNRFDGDRTKSLRTDSSDLEPRRRPAFSAADALTSRAGFHPPSVDADVGEHFDEKERNGTITDSVSG